MSCIVKFQKFLCSDLLGLSLERIMAWGASGREGMGLRACCQNKGLQHLNGRVAYLQTITWRQLRTWSLCSRCSRITSLRNTLNRQKRCLKSCLLHLLAWFQLQCYTKALNLWYQSPIPGPSCRKSGKHNFYLYNFFNIGKHICRLGWVVIELIWYVQ